jgi:uncharacterized membrane protein YqjE
MDTPPETDAHLAGAVKRILWRLMAVSHNRAELLMVEMHEERTRGQMIIFLGAGVAVFGILAILTVTAVIACAFARHLLLALGVLAAFYCIGAFFFYVKLARMLRRWEPFTSTRDQIDRDRECLEKRHI